MNEILGKNLNKDESIEYIYAPNKNKIVDPFEIVDSFNHYFTNVGKNLTDNNTFEL